MIERKQNGIAFLTGRWPLDPDRPTLVFIHGSGQQGSFWQAQVEGLAVAANTIAVDLPGHGNSPAMGSGPCRHMRCRSWNLSMPSTPPPPSPAD